MLLALWLWVPSTMSSPGGDKPFERVSDAHINIATLTVSVVEAGGMTLVSKVIKVQQCGLLQSCVGQAFLFQTLIAARCP